MAEVFIGKPKRVTLAELKQIQEEVAEGARAKTLASRDATQPPEEPVAVLSAPPLSEPAPCEPPCLADLLKARCEAGYWKNAHHRWAARVKDIQLQLAAA